MTPSAPSAQHQAPAFIHRAETTPGTEAARPWAIRMEGIGKQYRLAGPQALNDNLREEIMSALARLMRRRESPRDKGTFWALKDVSLEVGRGETLGIIGRNGAGKSTLLKILSRITPPTEGTMRYRGRLQSLLEIGTGFHRELTGLENIYLNGSILGMKRAEINQQFPAIVEFSGIEKFIHTPVKFYSSGMYVRLAFAVAAHLRADILIVDEVLAVGDAEFQKKCLGKMQDVAGDGRTVLFVSHNMTAILGLCQRGIVLEEGRIRFQGDAGRAAREYADTTRSASSAVTLAQRTDRKGSGVVKLAGMRTVDPADGQARPASSGADLGIVFEIQAEGPVKDVRIDCAFKRADGLVLFHASNATTKEPLSLPPGRSEILLSIPKLSLPQGSYPMNVFVQVKGEVADWLTDAWILEVQEGDYFGTGVTPPLSHSLFFQPFSWRAWRDRGSG